MSSRLDNMQRAFLQTLVDGKLDISAYECGVRQERLKLKWMQPPFVVVEIAPEFSFVDNATKDDRIFEYEQAVGRIIKNTGLKYYCFCNSFNNFVIILLLNDITPNGLDELFVMIHEKLYLEMGLSLFIGIGSFVKELRKLSQSAADAHLMLAYKYQYANRGVVSIHNLVKFQRSISISTSVFLDRVLGCFQDGNLGKMEIRLSELIEEVRSRPNMSSDSIKRILIEVAIRILNEASYAGVDVERVLEGKDPYNWILEQKSIAANTDWIMQISSQLLSQMENRFESQEKYAILQAKAFIESKLTESELNLDQISSEVGLSSTYFSRVFKKETGVGISSYILELRMKRAKQLLINTELKLDDISKQTGFQTTSYFCRAFKKNSGMTPIAFRRMNSKNLK